MRNRGVKMAQQSEGNGRSQAVILLGYGHFASRAKPFWRLKDLTHFAQGVVGKLGNIDIFPSLAA